MSSLLSLLLILFLVFTARNKRLNRGGRSLSVPPVRKTTADPSDPEGKSFSERYREDPAQTAGMKGRTSTVPASGRSAILEADNDLDNMLAGRKFHVPGKDSSYGSRFARADRSVNRFKDSSFFEGLEDRQNDWLARQLREEQRSKARMMSDMMSLKLEHEKNHRRENRVIGKR